MSLDRDDNAGGAAPKRLEPGQEETPMPAPGDASSTIDLSKSQVRSSRPALGFPTVDPGNYAVGQEFARGGQGRVLSAQDRRLRRLVAIKNFLETV
jgi:hypothetical protein